MKIYGFCKLVTYNSMALGRLLIKDELDKDRTKLTIGVYVQVQTEINYEDFNLIENIPTNYDTDSFQIRTKAVYFDGKRYFVKLSGKKSYLKDYDVASMKAIFKFEVTE